MIEVVNVKTDEFDVYIGRRFKRGKYNFEQSKFNNPYKLADYNGNRKQCLMAYRDYLYDSYNDGHITKKDLLELKNKRLGCWCKPLSCHGDILKEFIERIT